MATVNEIVQVIFRAKNELTGPVANARNAIKEFNAAIGNGHKAIGEMTSSLMGLGAAYFGITNIVNGLKTFSASLSETATSVETARIRLNAMYGDVEKAGEVFDFMNTYAAKSPATFKEVIEAGTQVKAFGLDIQTWMTPLGDLAAYMGVSLPEAASALGRAYAGGVGAADIFREHGILNVIKSFKGIDDLTKMTLPEFRKAMYETFTSAKSGVAGQTENLAKSWAGLISMLEDAWFRFQQDVLDSGLLESIKNKVRDLLAEIDKMSKNGKLKKWAEDTGAVLAALARYIAFAARVLKGLFDLISNNKTLFQSIAWIGGLSLAFSKFIPIITSAGIWMGGFLGIIKAAPVVLAETAAGVEATGAAAATAGTGFTAMLGPIGLVVAALTAALNLWTDWINRQSDDEIKDVNAIGAVVREVHARREYAVKNKYELKKIAAGGGDLTKLSNAELQSLYSVADKVAQAKEDKANAARQLKTEKIAIYGPKRKVVVPGVGSLGQETTTKEIQDVIGYKTITPAERVDKLYKASPLGISSTMAEMVKNKIAAEMKKRSITPGVVPPDFGGGGSNKTAISATKKMMSEINSLNRKEEDEQRRHYAELLKYAIAHGLDTSGIYAAIAKLDAEDAKKHAEAHKARVANQKKFTGEMVEGWNSMIAGLRAANEIIIQVTQGQAAFEKYQALQEWQEAKKKYGDLEELRLRYYKRITEIDTAEYQKKQQKAAARNKISLRANAPDEFNLPLKMSELTDQFNETAKAGRMTDAVKIYFNDLQKLYDEHDAWKRAQAGYYAAFNLATLNRMLSDTTRSEEEKTKVREEINKRVAANEIATQDAIRTGITDTLARFQSNAQIWLEYGQNLATGLRDSFSNIFVAGMKGDIDGIKGAWQSLCNSMRDAFLKAIADILAQKMVSGLFGNLLGGGKSSGGGETKSSITGGLAQLGSLLKFAEGGIVPGALYPIRAFADGGITRQPLLAAIGGGPLDPGGGPEAIVPLTPAGIAKFAAGIGGGNTTITHHHHYQINAIDTESFQHALASKGRGIIESFAADVAPAAVAANINGAGVMRNYVRR